MQNITKNKPSGKQYNTIWLFNIAMENPLQMEVLNGPFSIAMLNNQRIIL